MKRALKSLFEQKHETNYQRFKKLLIDKHQKFPKSLFRGHLEEHYHDLLCYERPFDFT